MIRAPALATAAMELLDQIRPMLHGRDPGVQGAVLADLTAIWLAGWAPAIREDVLRMHMEQIRVLIEVNEKIIFGEKGHPQR
jgi:hypothetical protein